MTTAQKIQEDASQIVSEMFNPKGSSIWPNLKEFMILLADHQSPFTPCSFLGLHLICEHGSEFDWTYQIRRRTNMDICINHIQEVSEFQYACRLISVMLIILIWPIGPCHVLVGLSCQSLACYANIYHPSRTRCLK